MYGAQRIEAALNLEVQVAGRFAQINASPEIRVAMIEAQPLLLQVLSQMSELTEQLGNLLGLSSSTRYELVEPLPPAVPVNEAEEAVQLALRCNPQVQESMATVEKPRAALRIANADIIPDVNIFGSYFNQNSAGYIHPNFGVFGVSAFDTFFDWGKRSRVKDRRETQITQASYSGRATIEKVRLETVQAYVGYQQAQQAFDLAYDMARARKDAESRQKDAAGLATAKAATAKIRTGIYPSEDRLPRRPCSSRRRDRGSVIRACKGLPERLA
jgi:hypothetical protein